ncbi:MAG: hypothetical protein K2X35_08415 [Bryobacteraceae bacterium]|nr:hypothetical protein [Bryobacteraceae bacterium]
MSDRCRICENRKPRRFCPGISGDICPVCCGEQREETIDCPLGCPYLSESRRHERQQLKSLDEFPNQDVKITEAFLRDHENLVLYLSVALLRAARANPGATDGDVREALQSLIRTYRTLDSGLIYETRPANPYAAAIQDKLQADVEGARKTVAEQSGGGGIRDAEILGTFVFLERLEIQHNNGRRKSRGFIDFLRLQLGMPAEVEPGVISG